MLKQTFKAFQYPDFRVLWIGACTSSIGTWMQILAQSWLVYELTKKATGDPNQAAFMLGLDSFLGQIPIFLFSLIGGVIADRVERRNLLIMSQAVQMSCAFTLTILVATGYVRVWQILCLSFIVGLAQSIGGPAYQALVPSLVKQEDLPNAIALNSIQFNLARVVGPTIGGFAREAWGAAWCFGLNGISYVAVIISLLLIKTRFLPKKTGDSILESMKEGISFVRRQPAMVTLIGLAFCMTFLAIPLMNFLPVFAGEVLHGSSQTFAILLACSGIGSVAGALGVAAGTRKGQGRFALFMMVLLGVTITAFSLSRNQIASAVLVFISGASLIAVFALISSLVQTITPNDMRGRVMSVYNVAFRGGMPFGSLMVGSLAKWFSVPMVLACNGILLALLGIYFLTVNRKVAEL